MSAKLLFRKHCGGFAASMATVVEIKTIHDLTNEVGKVLLKMVSDGMIRAEFYAHDERNNWDTYGVTVTGIDGYVGFTNGPIKHL